MFEKCNGCLCLCGSSPASPTNFNKEIKLDKMKFNFELKTYQDKFLILPREEFAWERTNKIFVIKLGWFLWDFRFKFNF